MFYYPIVSIVNSHLHPIVEIFFAQSLFFCLFKVNRNESVDWEKEIGTV
jgi:hypothetical protein